MDEIDNQTLVSLVDAEEEVRRVTEELSDLRTDIERYQKANDILREQRDDLQTNLRDTLAERNALYALIQDAIPTADKIMDMLMASVRSEVFSKYQALANKELGIEEEDEPED